MFATTSTAEPPDPAAGPGRFGFAIREATDRPFARVRLLHGLSGYREPPVLERRDGGWHTLVIDGLGVNRMEYLFEVTGPRGAIRTLLDPASPFKVSDPFGAKSVAIGAGYAEPLYAGPAGAAAGRLEYLEHEGLDCAVWEPPGSAGGEAGLPLLVVLDGADYVRLAQMPNALANLVAWRRIPPCRAVFMRPVERNREYSVHSGLVDVLASLPIAATRRIGVGASLGGLALLHAHVTRPGLFDGLLLQSGSFFRPATDAVEHRFEHFDRIAAFVAGVLDGSSRVEPIPVHLTCGRAGENLPNNRAMAKALRDVHGCAADLVEVPDAHNWTAWRDCLGPGLERLLHP